MALRHRPVALSVVLVTGMSGAGKSSALAELRKRGFALLSAPAEVLLQRIATRKTNDYGKNDAARPRCTRTPAEEARQQ